VKLVASGAAVAIIPESCLNDALSVAPNLACAALDRYDTRRSISIMRRKGNLATEAAQDFWTFVMGFYGLAENM
jgi:DNA-binding transcriptional LysR family regulator